MEFAIGPAHGLSAGKLWVFEDPPFKKRASRRTVEPAVSLVNQSGVGVVKVTQAFTCITEAT